MLEKFESYLVAEKRYSSHTVIAYLKDVRQFLDAVEIDMLEDLKDVKHSLIRSWMVQLIEQGIVHRSINRKLSTLRTFFKWCVQEAILETNPMVKIIGPKTEKRLPSFVREQDISVTRLADVFSNNELGQRDQLMFELFYQTGIRLSELIELKKQDFKARQIKVLGKRNKERIIPLSNDLSEALNQYQQNLQGVQQESNYLFTLKNGDKIYPKLVYRKINYYLGLITSLEKKSPHVLRHTFATHMLNNGAGLETLKDILGHANLSATQVYTHNSFSQLTTIYKQAHPRGHKKK
ncbi:MAG: integrase [Crocinitomicaceae bacterium]|nr:integrase [Crocinitomicaceae bacterium]